MSALAASSPPDAFQHADLQRAREVLSAEIQSLQALHDSLRDELGPVFLAAVDALVLCRGKVIVTGIGKAGLVGQKICASLSSTGTPSHFLHASEAVHGDLGCVSRDDVVLILSYSGETEEVVRLLPIFDELASKTIAITGHEASTLGRSVDVPLLIGQHPEACNLGLAPSTSTTRMLALGDALALVVSRRRGFTREDFARFHPAGNLGRKLMDVAQVMRPIEQCRVASEQQTVREVFIGVSKPGRRTGAIMLTDESGKLTGIFTDSDLARLLERSGDQRMDQPVNTVMSRTFRTIGVGCKLEQAIRVLSEFRISELPVVDERGHPLGIVDITDVLDVAPVPQSTSTTAPPPTATPKRENDDSLRPRILPLKRL